MKNIIYILLFAIIAFTGIFSLVFCARKAPATKPQLSNVKHVEWSKNAVIYEANIRQYSPEGTFKAFAKDLPRLKELGIDIIWVMPINPIGEKNRKGKLGSYYSVKDYKAINPEYGNLDDFKNMVNETHKLGMKLIIDWVPNHSAWDNELLQTHPEYYLKDSLGKFFHHSIGQMFYVSIIKTPEMRKWMIETMKYRLIETNIDGFRWDVAHNGPG